MKLHPSKIYRLACFEEAAGVLHELTEKEGTLVAHIGKIHLALPHELEPSFRSLISQRITILRTDIPGKQYIPRVIVKEDEKDVE